MVQVVYLLGLWSRLSGVDMHMAPEYSCTCHNNSCMSTTSCTMKLWQCMIGLFVLLWFAIEVMPALCCFLRVTP